MHKLLNKQYLYTLFITTINAHATKVVMTEKKIEVITDTGQ